MAARRAPWGRITLAIALIASVLYLDLRPEQLWGGFRNLGRLYRDAMPPQTDLLPAAV